MQELPLNPYVSWERPEAPSRWVGRAVIIESLAAHLRAPPFQEAVIAGRPGTGKSALLKELPRRLPKAGKYLPVHVRDTDSSAADAHDFLRMVAGDIAREAGRAPPAPNGEFSQAFTRTWLPALLGGIPRKTLLLLVDDVDRLVRRYGAPLLEALRGLRVPPLRGQVAVVYTIEGREEALSPETTALLAGVPRARLGNWDRAEVEELIHVAEKDGTLTWTPQAVEALWSLTGGHPLLTRRLCSDVWTRLHVDRLEIQPEVSLVALRDAATSTLLGARDVLRAAWAELPPATQLVAALVAAAGENPVTTQRVGISLVTAGLPPPILTLALGATAAQQEELLVFEPVDDEHASPPPAGFSTPVGGEAHPGTIRFRAELFRRWVHTHRPVPVVVAEVERRLAHRLPELLVDGHAVESTNPEETATQELAALARPPRAPGSLSPPPDDDTLQRVLDRLRAVAERFPAVGRPGLLAALHTAALHGHDEDRRLTWIAMALEIDASSPIALGERAAIWRTRAVRARESGQPHGTADLEALRAEASVVTARARRETEAAEELQDIEDLVTAWRYTDAAERLDPQRELVNEFYAERTKAIEENIEIGSLRAADLSKARESLRAGQVQRAIALSQRALDFDPQWPDAREILSAAQRALETYDTEAPPLPPSPLRGRSLTPARVPYGGSRGPARPPPRPAAAPRPPAPRLPAIPTRPPPLPLPTVAGPGGQIRPAAPTVPLPRTTARPDAELQDTPATTNTSPSTPARNTSPTAAPITSAGGSGRGPTPTPNLAKTPPPRAPAPPPAPAVSPTERGWQLVAAALGMLVLVLLGAHWYQRPRTPEMAVDVKVQTSVPPRKTPTLLVDGQRTAMSGEGTAYSVRVPILPGSHLWAVTTDGICAERCPGGDCPACCAVCSGRFEAGPAEPNPQLACTLTPQESPEVCDDAGVDEDCNGSANEADPGLTDARDWYPDADGDGQGDAHATPLRGCATTARARMGDGPRPVGDDCDDQQASVHIGAIDIPGDGIDQDCDGQDAMAIAAEPSHVSVTSPDPASRETARRATDPKGARIRADAAIIDDASANTVFSKASPSIMACRKRESITTRVAPDRITMTVRVYPDQKVGDVQVLSTSLENRAAIRCITDVAWGLQFPTPGGKSGTPLTYTWLLP